MARRDMSAISEGLNAAYRCAPLCTAYGYLGKKRSVV
jgi:hypothetical protein